ncbi:MAG: AMP-binding protein [Pseudomonadota bacterium]
MNGNFYHRLDEAMAAAADKLALVHPDGTGLRYDALREQARALAGALEAAGVRSGDRVLVQVDKSMTCVATYLAVLRLGAVYVPLNTAYTDVEVDYFVRDAAPALFLHEASRELEGALLATLAEVECRALPLGRLPEDAPGEAGMDGTLVSARVALDTPPASLADDALAAIVYTSGTTGRSKGAMLSHRNIESNARTLNELWGWRADDVLLHALPIFHVHGLFVALHCALLGGSIIRFLPRFDAATVCAQLTDSTVLMGVPTFYTRLLDLPQFDRAAVATMRLFISGSAPLTEITFAEFEARTGQRILERYGMSETLMITSNPLEGARIAGTVGPALPGVETRIAGDDGQPLPAGEVGTIEVRGPNVFSGYWRNPEKTRAEFREGGFFITGDLATADDTGRIAIVGRSKDLVISGGYNVYPKEVERLLDALPGIAESAVIGVPHRDFGEAVVAVVVTASGAAPPDLATLRAALADQLASYKQPKAVEVLTELPRNAMGKVQKNLLRAQFEGLFAT